MKTSGLFEPVSVGNMQLKNRVVLAPMTRGRAGSERIARRNFIIRDPAQAS